MAREQKSTHAVLQSDCGNVTLIMRQACMEKRPTFDLGTEWYPATLGRGCKFCNPDRPYDEGVTPVPSGLATLNLRISLLRVGPGETWRRPHKYMSGIGQTAMKSKIAVQARNLLETASNVAIPSSI